MSFLAPLFLLGSLAIGLPILFHLIRQTTRERTVFSSLLLLEPTPPRLTRRSRLNNILLLILRCTVLGLLAFGFARPFLSKPVTQSPGQSGPGRILVLLDTSASMRRTGQWEQAKKQALSVVRKATPADQLAIYAFDRDTRPILGFEEWNETPVDRRLAVAEARVGALTPGWAATRTGAALQKGAELLADASRNQVGGRKELVLISDLQEGSRFETIQGYEWPKDLRLSVAPVMAKRSANAAIQLLPEGETAETSASRPIRFRVFNSPDSPREQFRAAWMSNAGDTPVSPPIELYVPAGQGRTFSIPAPEGTNKPTRLVLSGDQEEYDNAVYVVQPDPAKAVIVYLGRDARPTKAGVAQTTEDDPKAPLYFLRRAFAGTTARETIFTTLDPAQTLASGQIDSASLLVATHLEPNANLALLRKTVESGKTLLVSVDGAQMGQGLAMLLECPRLDFTERKPSNFALFAEIDYKHPLFAPFADPRFADFSKVRFWSYVRIDPAQMPDAHVLARFDGGDPALLEVPVGRGKVIILAAGWQPEKSQFALSTKFVPFVHTILEQSGNAPPPSAQLLVGDGLPLPGEQANASVTGPDGAVRELSASTLTNVSALLPGVYTLRSGSNVFRFAVNMDPAESRPGAVNVEDLEKMGAPVQAAQQPTVAQVAARQTRLRNAELENRQKLWRYIILASVAVLFVETWLSGRTTRRILLQGAPS